jgi:hypothetical protein
MNVPNVQGWTEDFQSTGSSWVVEAKHWPAQGRSGPWKEDIIGQATFEDYEEDLDRSGSILLGPQVPMVQMKRGDHPDDLLMDTSMTHSVVTQ